jgi:hypothetical protein
VGKARQPPMKASFELKTSKGTPLYQDREA